MPRSKSHVYDATKPTPIFSLPQEILLDVLLLVQPHDLSAFSQTCSKASHLVTDSSYLWRGMYLKAWDPTISSVNALPVLSADQPRPIRNPYSHKGKGKAKEHQDPPPATTTSITPSLQTLVKQRTKARLNLRRGSYDPHYLLVHHEETLRDLIAAARARLPRTHDPHRPNVDLPSSRSASSLATMFPRNRVGDTRWAAFVYPRESLERLQDWQYDIAHDHAFEEALANANKKTTHPTNSRQRHGASDPSQNTSAHTPTLDESADTIAGSSSSRNARKRTASNVSAATSTAPPRRSARIRKGGIPRRFHSFIGRGLTDVEALGTTLQEWKVKDQLSAELHVLHGIRLMKRESPMDKLQKAEDRLKQRRAAKRSAAGAAARQTYPHSHFNGSAATRSAVPDRLRSSSHFAPTEEDTESSYESAYEDGCAADDAPDLQPMLPQSTLLLAETQMHHQPSQEADDSGDEDFTEASAQDTQHTTQDAPDGQDTSSRDTLTESIAPSSTMTDLVDGDYDVIQGYATPSDDEMDYLMDMDDIDGIAHADTPAFLFGRQLERADLLLGSEDGPSGDPELFGRAKSVVYDVGRFAYENAWGPLHPFRDSEDRPEDQRGPFFGAFDDDSDDDDDEEIYDSHGTGIDTGGSSTGSADDEGDHHEAPLVVDETAQEATQDAQTSALPVPSGTAPVNQAIHTPSSTDNNAQPAQRDAARGLSASALDDDAGHLPQSGMVMDDDDEIALEDSDGDGDSGDLFPLGTEDEVSDDDSVLDDLFGHHEDIFARRVAFVGAYAGSKVRMMTLDSQIESPSTGTGWTGKLEGPRSTQRQVDWVVLESIMIVVHCNIVRGIRNDGWGQGFTLPSGARRDDSDSVRPLVGSHICEHLRPLKHLLPPRGWSHSRGTMNGPSASPCDESSRPRDWANIEQACWTGTYFFCDYRVFLKYNADLAESPHSGHARRDFDFFYHREAIGDCLALRLELLSPEEEAQRIETEKEKGDSDETMGEDDPEFPTIRFKGRTFTYVPDGLEPLPRGQTHGFVRPVYATHEESAQRPYLRRYHAASGRYLPEIVALHWKIVHVYEGEDRWSLTGIQAGPPGTRAPIYGMWSDVDEGNGSPVGPFAYFNVDSRPWREVERLLSEEKAEAERRRRLMTRDSESEQAAT